MTTGTRKTDYGRTLPKPEDALPREDSAKRRKTVSKQ